jgi:hypothetical protein
MWKVLWFLVTNAGAIYDAINTILEVVSGEKDKCEVKK